MSGSPRTSYQRSVGGLDSYLTHERGSDEDRVDDKTPPASGAATVDPAASLEAKPQKRGRGRPKKEAPSEPQPEKIRKRCKTGCGTCRDRKKKCDEAKPMCNNCTRGNYICKGYLAETTQDARPEEAIHGSSEMPHRLPILIEGVEDDLDWELLDHFIDRVGPELSPFGTGVGPFINLLLDMAKRKTGAMHSLLCLAASSLLKHQPNESTDMRRMYHYDQALRLLQKDKSFMAHDRDRAVPGGDPVLVQTFLLLLHCVSEGDSAGSRTHLGTATVTISQHPRRDSEICKFIGDYLRYFVTSNAITSVVQQAFSPSETLEFLDTVPCHAVHPFVAWKGLSTLVMKIAYMRNERRSRTQQALDPVIGMDTLQEAGKIDQELRTWTLSSPPGGSRYFTSLLYLLCVRLYLIRTVHPAREDDLLSKCVDEGLEYLQELLGDRSAYPILLMPLFLLGCSAFEFDQRTSIHNGFRLLERQRAFKIVAPLRNVVERTWQLMDAGDKENWDWESTMQRMGLDFMII